MKLRWKLSSSFRGPKSGECQCGSRLSRGGRCAGYSLCEGLRRHGRGGGWTKATPLLRGKVADHCGRSRPGCLPVPSHRGERENVLSVRPRPQVRPQVSGSDKFTPNKPVPSTAPCARRTWNCLRRKVTGEAGCLFVPGSHQSLS